MNNSQVPESRGFRELFNRIPDITKNHHASTLLDHAKANVPYLKKDIYDLPKPSGKKASSCIAISAGPSLQRKNSIERILRANYPGSIVAADGAYLACVRAGLVPDYVVTLDPHASRITRWFGDHDFERHSEQDDYFERQELNTELRKNGVAQNQEDIALVDRYGHLTKAIVSSSAPMNVTQRLMEAKFDIYGWNPLVDNPKRRGSLTRKLYQINRLPCMNTGGNVGTASWVFSAAILEFSQIALIGMDFGYYRDTPLRNTQYYYELLDHAGGEEKLVDYFVDFTFPLTGEGFFTDPVYYWYRRNFLDLYKQTGVKTYNCTEGGILFDSDFECMALDTYLERNG